MIPRLELSRSQIPEFSMNLPVWNFLEEHGYNTSLRGEQTYCIAVKRAGLPVERFLYSDQ